MDETPNEREELPKNPPKTRKKKIIVWITAIVTAIVVFFCGGLSLWFSLDKEMRDLIKVKKAVDKEYYQDVDDDVFYGAIFGAINGRVLDAYSGYMTADEYASLKRDNAGSRSGIGISFYTKAADGTAQMLVVRVSGNSPAESVGLQAGDYIVGFGKTENELVECCEFDKFSAFLGERADGERFWIRIRRGEELQNLELYKAAYVENYVFYKTNERSYSFNSKRELVESAGGYAFLGDDTAYIRLIQFNGNAVSGFQKAMELFRSAGKKHLVLDLRGNGGGDMEVMQSIASYFCKSSTEMYPVAAVADYGEKRSKFTANGNFYSMYFSAESRILVLADSSTASASECLIGCMVDYGAIGYGDICLTNANGIAKTYGKGIMQTTYPLGLGKSSAIKLTTAVIRWPVSDTCIHDRGILPEDGALTVDEQFPDAELIETAFEKWKNS
ncbi:MAG: hypothetical protein IKA88_06425 [Clostridia bacterium]|nr:hypothetical protein [Clostridia bacterium]